MKIIATADTHGKLPWLSGPFDLAIFAGDICPITDPRYPYRDIQQPPYQLEWLKTVWVPYLKGLIAGGVVDDIVYTFGNHDFIGESELDIDFLWETPHIYPLVNEMVEIAGRQVFGYPYVGNLPGWAFNRNENQLDILASRIPKCDILVSHAPPYGFGDVTTDFTGPVHVGDPFLAANLKRIDPKLVVCGHIHEGYGHYRHPAVKEGICSVSYLDGNYQKSGREPVVIIV